MHDIENEKEPFVLGALRKGEHSSDILRTALLLRGDAQDQLFALARERRETCYPHKHVEVRSVIELSNICEQRCRYCAIGSSGIERYTIGYDEFLALAKHVYSLGRRVLLLQSGESGDPDFVDLVCRCVEKLLAEHSDIVVILCMGNLKYAQYKQLRDAGAQRYILKFETSNSELYRKLKPRDDLMHRLECTHMLSELGVQVGSGNIVGLPGQTMDDLVNDLELLGKLDLSMNSTTVFIPGEGTPLQDEEPGCVEKTLNMMALMRILFPQRLIPTTSSLSRCCENGQWRGLMAGANTITSHDGTPDYLKKLVPIYSRQRYAPQLERLALMVNRAGVTMKQEALI